MWATLLCAGKQSTVATLKGPGGQAEGPFGERDILATCSRPAFWSGVKGRSPSVLNHTGLPLGCTAEPGGSLQVGRCCLPMVFPVGPCLEGSYCLCVTLPLPVSKQQKDTDTFLTLFSAQLREALLLHIIRVRLVGVGWLQGTGGSRF